MGLLLWSSSSRYSLASATYLSYAQLLLLGARITHNDTAVAVSCGDCHDAHPRTQLRDLFLLQLDVRLRRRRNDTACDRKHRLARFHHLRCDECAMGTVSPHPLLRVLDFELMRRQSRVLLLP